MGKTLEKPKSYDLRNQKWIRESVTRGEGISTPQRPFIRTVPLINCAKNVNFQKIYFTPRKTCLHYLCIFLKKKNERSVFGFYFRMPVGIGSRPTYSR